MIENVIYVISYPNSSHGVYSSSASLALHFITNSSKISSDIDINPRKLRKLNKQHDSDTQ